MNEKLIPVKLGHHYVKYGLRMRTWHWDISVSIHDDKYADEETIQQSGLCY